MSIEQKIEDLTTQVKALTTVLAATLAFQQAAHAGGATAKAVVEEADEAKPTAADKKAAEKKAAAKPTAADKKAADKKAAAEKAAADADDGLDEDENDDGLGGGDREYSLTEMKEVLIALKDKTGDKAAPLGILSEFGYTGIPSVAEKDATAIGRAAQEALDKL